MPQLVRWHGVAQDQSVPRLADARRRPSASREQSSKRIGVIRDAL